MPARRMRRPHGIAVCKPHAEVRLFEEQPSTWTKPRGHPPDDFQVVRDVHEHGTCVDEVERPFREAVAANVVSNYLDICRIDRVQEVNLEVCRRHVPVRTNMFSKPAGDRAVTATDLETRGANSDLEPLDAPDRQRVEPLLKELETTRLVIGGMRKGVIGSLVHAPILSRSPSSVERPIPAGWFANRSALTAMATLAAVPHYICPKCKERSVDIDAREGFSTQAPACRHCGFGFLFELLDDYYPAPDTGLVVTDQERRVLAIGRGVFELTGFPEADLMGLDIVEVLQFSDAKPVELAREWGVRRLGEQLSIRTRGGSEKRVIADVFPAYDDDGGLLVALTPQRGNSLS